MEKRNSIMVGNFDGVHLGHRTLVGRARSHCAGSGRVIAITFDPHPAAALHPDRAPELLEPFAVRAQRLRAAGVDEVVALEPTPELLSMAPERFLSMIQERYNPRAMVEGHDFRYGKARAGTPGTLRDWCGDQGIVADIVGPVTVALTNQHLVTASSSLVRWLLKHGRVRDASLVLGRDHELSGTVVQGQQLGRTIGVPTINLETGAMLPGDGVYSGFARVGDRWVPAAINVGDRPTVSGSDKRLEAHLINRDGTPWSVPDDLDEYGWETSVRLVGWVRDQVRFGSVEALSAQIRRDARCAVRTLGVA